MKMKNFSRRKFIVNASVGTAGALLASRVPVFGNSNYVLDAELAIKGGNPVRTDGWLKWPVWNTYGKRMALGRILDI